MYAMKILVIVFSVKDYVSSGEKDMDRKMEKTSTKNCLFKLSVS